MNSCVPSKSANYCSSSYQLGSGSGKSSVSSGSLTSILISIHLSSELRSMVEGGYSTKNGSELTQLVNCSTRVNSVS